MSKSTWLCLAATFLLVLVLVSMGDPVRAYFPNFVNHAASPKGDDNNWLDDVDCSQIQAMGLDKQTNMHAALIRIHCGQERGGRADAIYPTLPMIIDRSAQPANYGDVDANVIDNWNSDSFPHVTQSESVVWSNGNTVVVNYNDTSGSPGCIAGISYSVGGGSFTRVRSAPLCSGHGMNAGDPILVFNAKLNNGSGMWLAGDLAVGCNSNSMGRGIGLWTSFDGITWSPGACAHGTTTTYASDDRPSMWVDNNPNSDFYGRMYISFNDFVADPAYGALHLIYSDDGTNWISPPLIHTGSPFLRNGLITGGSDNYPNGTSSAIFLPALGTGTQAYSTRTNNMYHSTNGGVDWIVPSPGPATNFAAPGDGTVCIRGMLEFARIPPNWSYEGAGQAGVGPGGVVHYVYTARAYPSPTPSDPGDIYYIRSTDNGSTWSTPVVLNTDAPSGTRAQWLPGLSVTTQGAVFVSWYDRRNTNNDDYEYWGRASYTNGASWEPDMPISDGPIPAALQWDPNGPACFAGDYDYHSAYGTSNYLTWTDGRSLIPNQLGTPVPQQDVYFDEVTLSAATATPPPTPCPIQFQDIGCNTRFYRQVRCLAERGIVNGYPCGGLGEPCVPPGNLPYYRPNNHLTRGQISKMVALAATFSDPIPPTQQTFEDVPPGSTFWLYIEWVALHNVVEGYPCGSPGEPCIAPGNRPYFRPYNNTTRGQLCKMVSLGAGWTPPIPPTQQTYEDVPPGSTFWLDIEREKIKSALNGFGYACGGPGEPCVPPANRLYFRPYSTATRGEAAHVTSITFFDRCGLDDGGDTPGGGAPGGAPATGLSPTPPPGTPPAGNTATSTVTLPSPIPTAPLPTPLPTGPVPTVGGTK